MKHSPLPITIENAALQDDLLVAFLPKHDFLLSKDQRPIWPAHDAEEMKALKEVSGAFGTSIRKVQGSPGISEPDSEEIVVALGQGIEDLAKLYAHLTRRHLRFANDLPDIKEVGSFAVLITTPLWLNSELFNILYEFDSDTCAPGVICAEPRMLRLQVLVKSAAASLAGPLNTRRIEIFPTLSINRFSLLSDREVFGAKVSAGDIREAMGRGAGILSIQTHSDGFDAFLNSNLTLCPMNWMPLGAIKRRSSRCVETGYCHRHERLMVDALRSNLLIFPDNISARILILDVCWGIIPVDGIVDPIWGIGVHLLANSSIGAVLTTWEINFPNPRRLNMLADAIDKGKTIGEALYLFNHSSESQRAGQRMCLLGDPRVHLPLKHKISSLSAESTSLSKLKHRISPLLIEDTEFLKIFLFGAVTRKSHTAQPIKGILEKATKAIKEYECAYLEGHPIESTSTNLGVALRLAVTEIVCRRGPLILNDWSPYANMRKLESHSSRQCFACRSQKSKLVTLKAEFDFPWIPNRRVAHCPTCGVVEDVPEDTFITMSVINKKEVELGGTLPREEWIAKLLIRSQEKSERVWWDWPADVGGAPLRKFKTQDSWPVGPLYVALVLMYKAKLIVISQLTSGSRLVPYFNN